MLRKYNQIYYSNVYTYKKAYRVQYIIIYTNRSTGIFDTFYYFHYNRIFFLYKMNSKKIKSYTGYTGTTVYLCSYQLSISLLVNDVVVFSTLGPRTTLGKMSLGIYSHRKLNFLCLHEYVIKIIFSGLFNTIS